MNHSFIDHRAQSNYNSLLLSLLVDIINSTIQLIIRIIQCLRHESSIITTREGKK